MNMNENKSIKRRYWLFVFSWYYPTGGLDDLEATSDDLEELRKLAQEKKESLTTVVIFDSAEEREIE